LGQATGEVRPDFKERYTLLELKSYRCQRTNIEKLLYFLLDFEQVVNHNRAPTTVTVHEENQTDQTDAIASAL